MSFQSLKFACRHLNNDPYQINLRLPNEDVNFLPSSHTKWSQKIRSLNTFNKCLDRVFYFLKAFWDSNFNIFRQLTGSNLYNIVSEPFLSVFWDYSQYWGNFSTLTIISSLSDGEFLLIKDTLAPSKTTGSITCPIVSNRIYRAQVKLSRTKNYWKYSYYRMFSGDFFISVIEGNRRMHSRSSGVSVKVDHISWDTSWK